MLKKKERGEYGYLKYKKTVLTLGFVGVLAASLGIFFLGLVLNKWETANLFTIVAILGVLPGAKMLTLLVVVLPHRSMDEKEKAMIDGLLQKDDAVFYDAVFTSKERPMHLDAIVVTGHQIIGYTTDKKDKIQKTEEYFKKECELRKADFVCFVTDSEKNFVNRFRMRNEDETLSEKQAVQRDMVLEFIRTAIV